MSECDFFVMEEQNEEWFELVEYVETFDMSISFLEGPPGPPGPAGEAIFIPHVSEEGVLSWTNTAGLPNPDPIDLSGPAGTTDYADLINRPSINGVELIGNKTTADLQISFSKADVGLGNVDNVRQYSASNPPPYPVTSVNGSVGAVSITLDGLGATDYVVEQGTLDGWSYIKYASGRAELWRSESAGVLTKGGTLNGWNWVTYTAVLPSILDSVCGAVSSAKWGTGVSWGGPRDVTRYSFQSVIFGNQDEVACTVEMHVWGAYL